MDWIPQAVGGLAWAILFYVMGALFGRQDLRWYEHILPLLLLILAYIAGLAYRIL